MKLAIPHARMMAAFVLAAAVLAPVAAFADDADAGIATGVSLGGRAMYYRAKDADGGDLSGGAQLHIPLSPMFTIEGSIDYRKTTFGENTVDVYPVQASPRIAHIRWADTSATTASC